MKTSFSFRDRVKRELAKARAGMGRGGKMTGNLIFTHSEVADILEDLSKLERIEGCDNPALLHSLITEQRP